MQWVIWALRLLLTALALSSAATLGLSTYWWVTLSAEPLPEEGAGWAALGRGLELINIGIYSLIPSAMGLLFFGCLAAAAWPGPWRKVILLATLWAGSMAFAVCGAAGGYDWFLIPTIFSLSFAWGLYGSIRAAAQQKPRQLPPGRDLGRRQSV